jgi:tripartite-type tricarboxylate transporter receptor subunit TctC
MRQQDREIPGFEAVSWQMVVAPARTPTVVVNRIHAELKGIIAVPEIRQQLVNIGMIPLSSAPPEELPRFIKSEIERWGEIVRRAGVAGSE